MQEDKFKRILRVGESRCIDFKINCQALQRRNLGANAELAKDICAMANNGNVLSHIIIGVSDDGKSFCSVKNPGLTDDNLQDFTKRAITPPPRVKLLKRKYTNTNRRYKGKQLVIVKVGPQARQAFRLNRDFIDYKQKTCYRKNEVWLRRGATSDLATPEEIARLVSGDTPFKEESGIERTVFTRVPRKDQREAVLRDLSMIADNMGGRLVRQSNDQAPARLCLPFARGMVVLKVLTGMKFAHRFSIWRSVCNHWSYEHGVLIISLGGVAERTFPYGGRCEIHAKERWGWFTLLGTDDLEFTSPDIRLTLNFPVPENSSEGNLFILTIPNVKDTDQMSKRLRAMNDSILKEPVYSTVVQQTRKKTKGNLERWLQQGWLLDTGRREDHRPTRLNDNEVFNKRLYGDKVLVRERWQDLHTAARAVIQLSRK